MHRVLFEPGDEVLNGIMTVRQKFFITGKALAKTFEIHSVINLSFFNNTSSALLFIGNYPVVSKTVCLF